MSAGFHRTGLMDIDMSRDSAEHALVLAKCCIDHCDIGLCPPNQKMYIGIRCFADSFYPFCRLPAIFILSISRCLFHVCLFESS